jgi:hypothetical protein
MKHLILICMVLFSCTCTENDINERSAKNSADNPILVCETPEGCKVYTSLVGGYTTNIIVCKEPYNGSISR